MHPDRWAHYTGDDILFFNKSIPLYLKYLIKYYPMYLFTKKPMFIYAETFNPITQDFSLSIYNKIVYE